MVVYHHQVTVRIPVQADAGPLKVSITGQGCADAGLCYPPMTQTLELVPTDGGYQAVGEQVVDTVPPPPDEFAAVAGASALDVKTATPGATGALLGLADTGSAQWRAQAGLLQI